MAIDTGYVCVRGISVSSIFRLHYLMAQCSAEFNRFSQMICLKASKCGKKKENYCADSKANKYFSLAWIVQVNPGKLKCICRNTFPDTSLSEIHSNRDQDQPERHECRKDHIDKKSEVSVVLLRKL